jgi:hypothetical protein
MVNESSSRKIRLRIVLMLAAASLAAVPVTHGALAGVSRTADGGGNGPCCSGGGP